MTLRNLYFCYFGIESDQRRRVLPLAGVARVLVRTDMMAANAATELTCSQLIPFYADRARTPGGIIDPGGAPAVSIPSIFGYQTAASRGRPMMTSLSPSE